jgi:hypothetical protein
MDTVVNRLKLQVYGLWAATNVNVQVEREELYRMAE